ncbi:MAG: hypothetical protein M1819_002647 [Sarea resinae]|nr:MAG: hypothetical protein M1819_002647 [Sarea resinae]
MSKKRRREESNVDVELVEIYEDLANPDEKIRLKAAQTLLSKLSPRNSPSVQVVENVLNRLFRGLASPRKAARIGFSVALTEFLTQVLGPESSDIPDLKLDIDRVVEILKSRTQPTGGVSGQEERDHHLGRLFGAEAVIKSLVLFQPSSDTEHWAHVLDIIYDLARKKSWLLEECGWIIYGAIRTLSLKAIDKKYAEIALDRLVANGLAKSSEGVAIWLTVQSLFPEARLVKGIWRDEDPLHRKEKSALTKALKESGQSDEKETDGQSGLQKGMWTPKLPFAWDVVLSNLLLADQSTKDSAKRKRINITEFWEEVVDNGLFAASSSDERKFWGFLLFGKVLQDAPEQLLPVLFGKNFMRSLKNQLSSKDRYLHGAAQKALKAIHAKVEADPTVASAIIEQLLSEKGAINFDQSTKTKTVERLLVQCSDSALADTVSLFSRLIAKPQVQEQKASEARRQLLADQLVSALRSRTAGKSDAAVEEDPSRWIQRILSVFIGYGYFRAQLDPANPELLPEPPLSPKSQEMFQSRVSSCLTHMLSAESETPARFPYFVVCEIRDRESNDPMSVSLFNADSSIEKAVKRARKLLEDIHKKEQSRKGVRKAHLRAFKLLYSLTILQVYNGDGDAISILDELKACSEKVLDPKKGGGEEASDILVEVLLSFVSKPSVLFRKLAQQVFTAFAADITSEGLQSMITVLETKESMVGQQEMFDQDAEEVDDEDMLDSEGSDVESVDSSSQSSEEDQDDSSEDDDVEEIDALSDDASNDEEGDSDELKQFDAKLAEALGTHRADEDVGQNDDDSDEDMDDEQMMALEPHLTKVFQERKKVASKKQEKKDAKETIVNFKNRVLDLLEIYVKRQHANPLALDLILPLLKLIRTSTSKQVSEKACSVIREYAKACKGKDVATPTDVEATWTLLREVHGEATREASHAHSNACSQASLLLVKVLVGHDRENFKQAVKIYADTLTRWVLEKGCQAQPSLFTDWQNWCTSARKQLQR